MMPYARKIRDAVATHVAALPVPYRTTAEEPTFQSLTEKDMTCACCIPDGRSFPLALDPFQVTRFEIAEFGREAAAANIRYLGVCCGAGPHHIRALAEALGRRPPASRFSADMSKHYALGSDPSLGGTTGNSPRTSTGDARLAPVTTSGGRKPSSVGLRPDTSPRGRRGRRPFLPRRPSSGPWRNADADHCVARHQLC